MDLRSKQSDLTYYYIDKIKIQGLNIIDGLFKLKTNRAKNPLSHLDSAKIKN